MVDVIRKNCIAGEKAVFEMTAPSIAFLVKNFTNASLLACIGEWDEDQTIMVAAGTAESICTNPDPERCMTRATAQKVIIQPTETGTVEVIRND
ncbi:MAG: hypothetical protein ACI4PM_03145 [Butyricicoccus sp.]